MAVVRPPGSEALNWHAWARNSVLHLFCLRSFYVPVLLQSSLAFCEHEAESLVWSSGGHSPVAGFHCRILVCRCLYSSNAPDRCWVRKVLYNICLLCQKNLLRQFVRQSIMLRSLVFLVQIRVEPHLAPKARLPTVRILPVVALPNLLHQQEHL